MVVSTGYDRSYFPVAGDVVQIDFDPQAGDEITKRRPALVISPWAFNVHTRNLAVMCPITSRMKEDPFAVPIPEGLQVQGVIRVDQIKSMDWRVRRAEYLCYLPDETLEEVLEILSMLLEIPDFISDY